MGYGRGIGPGLGALALIGALWAGGALADAPLGTLEGAPEVAPEAAPGLFGPRVVESRPAPLPRPPEDAAAPGAAASRPAGPAPTALGPRELPWPPLKASARLDLPERAARGGQGGRLTLADADARLSLALLSAGYVRKSYLAAPQGFALATPLERIRPDGSPFPGAGRWAGDGAPMDRFGFSQYVEALESAEPGLYRVVLLTLAPRALYRGPAHPGANDYRLWVQDELNRLPSVVAEYRLSADYQAVAWVYEFEKLPGQTARPRIPGKIAAEDHLRGSGLAKALGQ
ncbi:MAG: hypothetical protein ACYDA8_22550 [Deferrisomatales bacterium]